MSEESNKCLIKFNAESFKPYYNSINIRSGMSLIRGLYAENHLHWRGKHGIHPQSQ
jgi:hypothetical protein